MSRYFIVCLVLVFEKCIFFLFVYVWNKKMLTICVSANLQHAQKAIYKIYLENTLFSMRLCIYIKKYRQFVSPGCLSTAYFKCNVTQTVRFNSQYSKYFSHTKEKFCFCFYCLKMHQCDTFRLKLNATTEIASTTKC